MSEDLPKYKNTSEAVLDILSTPIFYDSAFKALTSSTPTQTKFNFITGCNACIKSGNREYRAHWARLMYAMKPQLSAKDAWTSAHSKFQNDFNPDRELPEGFENVPVKPSTNTNQQGTTNMNDSTSNTTTTAAILAVITYVFGEDISKLDADNLITSIEQCRAEITRLEGLAIESKYVGKQVKELNKAIILMIKQLDNR